MIEYFTKAFVLAKEQDSEVDAIVHFYTEKLGKVSAKAKSLKKITSKLSPHLEPLNFVEVRLVGLEDNGRLRIADTLPYNKSFYLETKKSPEKTKKFLNIAEFLRNAVFENQPDEYLWQTIKKITKSDFSEQEAYHLLLKALGFDPEYAACDFCGNKKISHFHQQDHNFLCQKCASKTVKNGLILI